LTNEKHGSAKNKKKVRRTEMLWFEGRGEAKVTKKKK